MSHINLALVSFENREAKIKCSSRAMSDDGLEMINETALRLFEECGFDIHL